MTAMKGHKEIFEALRREILAGKYESDRRLPSEVALSQRFGVSRPTISRVTLDLKREGLVAIVLVRPIVLCACHLKEMVI